MKIGSGAPQTNNVSNADAFKDRPSSSVVIGKRNGLKGTSPPRSMTPAPARRSADAGVHHATVRAVSVETPADPRLASKADRRSQERDSEASETLSASPTRAPKATVSTDQLMTDVFDALEAGDASGVLASSKAFVAAVHTRDLRMAKTPAFSFDTHRDHFRSHLAGLPSERLESIRQTVTRVSGLAQDPVISGIQSAAEAELLLRMALHSQEDGAEFVLSGLSVDQLRALKRAVAQALDDASRAILSDLVPGTKSTRAELEVFRDGANLLLAIKVVQSNHLKSADELAKLPNAELIETAWAVAWCRSQAVEAPHGTQALSGESAKVDKARWGRTLDGLTAAIQEVQRRSAIASSNQRTNSSAL